MTVHPAAPLPSVGSPSPPPPPPHAPRAVHRLNITMESQATADFVARTRSPSLERAASPVEKAESRYPTPPAAPHKDQYISESDLESYFASPSDSPPSALFRNGELYVHKDYKGRFPLCHYATGLPAGHPHDFDVCFSERDNLWARSVRFHIERLQIALRARCLGAESHRDRS